jgi:plasmid stabilization system protein ParE
MRTIIIQPAAEADLAAACGWYKQQRTGLGDRFLDAATAAARFIGEHPEAYQVLHRGTRRAPLHGFPFGLLYRVEPDAIVVVGVFHARRDPRVWRLRLERRER